MGEKSAERISLDALKALLEYDPSTGHFKNKITRKRAAAGAIAGSRATIGYIDIRINGKHYWGHRLAWFYNHGEWPKFVDHINGDRADNRLQNLRSVTRKQNAWNRGIDSRSETGVKGVSKVRNKFVASIWQGRKHITLGSFDNLEDAAQVYDLAIQQFRGEYARLNQLG